MSESKRVCVVDCGETLARYRSQDNRVTDADMSAVLIAAAIQAEDNVYVDPMLEVGSVLPMARASAMVGALKSKIRDAIEPSILQLVHGAGDDQVISTNCRLEGSLVIVDISLINEGD
ncbi:hypothetical protein pEaSNUABM37_00244 [Erwinia phage pEa_SNUABM_37]|nr:hypothetical protein pEaSNUABM37_00244 [Erwinia phage pEa_SNUABM_37]QXO10712.1 hypothetical protein pEaSNUABM48_00244 [Erwinia phage pEa_SNUABM_48]